MRLCWPDPPLQSDQPSLLLRPWGLADAEVLVAGWCDPDVAAWNAVPEDPSMSTATRWISGAQHRLHHALSLDLVIVRRQGEHQGGDGVVVGEVGLSSFDQRHAAARIGWWLLPAGRGQGIATASLRQVTTWAHEVLELRLLVAQCAAGNVASQRVAAAAGYRHERDDRAGNQLWMSRIDVD